MPSVNCQCPNCAKQYHNIKSSLVGRKVQCECGTIVRLRDVADGGNAKPLKRRKRLEVIGPAIAEPPPIVEAPPIAMTCPPIATQETYAAQSVEEPPVLASVTELPVDKAYEDDLVAGERANPQDDPMDFSVPLTVSSRRPVELSPAAGQAEQKSEMNGWRWFLVGFYVFGNLFIGSLLLRISRKVSFADVEFQSDFLNEYPVALAAVPALSGLFLILKTIFGLFSGNHYGRFGYRTTGLDGKIYNWGELGLGTIFGLWGLSEVIKCLY